MEFMKIILTSIFSVITLFVITKFMGHKQVSQFDFFDYVSGITIGSIGAEMATDLDAPWKALIALIIYGIVSVSLNFLTSKFPKSRKYINGTPTILMSNDKLFRKNFKKAKLDLSEFLLLCREQGYFNLSDIEVAVFEHNGKLSVLPKAKTIPISREDLGICENKASIGIEVIMDGRILEENLTRLGFNKEWLIKKLSEKGYTGANEIFLGIYLQDKDNLLLYPSE